MTIVKVQSGLNIRSRTKKNKSMFKQPNGQPYFTCPHCKHILTRVAYNRTVSQGGTLELANLQFDKGTNDEDEIMDEWVQCEECEQQIDPALIPGLTN